MSPVPFDTHAVIQELETLGFATPQAEGLSRVLQTIFASQDYATKADITAIRTDIEALRQGTAADMRAVRNDIETLRLSAKADLTEATLRLEVKIEALKGDV